MTTLRRRLSWTIGYCLFLLVVLEVASRIFLGAIIDWNRNPGNSEAWWRHRWVSENRGLDLPSGQFFFSFDEHDPNCGWRLKPDIRDQRVFGEKLLNTDSRGRRGVREHRLEKPSGRIRIAVFGDSFTFGESLGDRETYPHRLQLLQPETEVINFGVHGYGLDQILILLEQEGVNYRPDIVMLGFVYQDLERNMLGFRDYAKPRFEMRDGVLIRIKGPVPSPQELLRREWRRSRLLDLLSMIGQGVYWKSFFDRYDHRRVELGKALVGQMQAVARGIGARFVLVDLSSPLRVPTDRLMKQEDRVFADLCRERGIPYVTMQPIFEDRMNRGICDEVEGHWNAAANRRIAEELRSFLQAEGLISPAGSPALR